MATTTCCSVEVATAGDFSTYTLRLVASAGVAAPPAGIDPALAQIAFSFKVDCPSDFDCSREDVCPPTPGVGPAIDYLARDYQSFRRLMLDRLSALMPDWRERNPADLWVALAEAVAFRGDELSYYQDAVATEAYLGTARQRVSVRRHTRLLDYAFHDGCNARAWIAFEVDAAADGLTLPGCDPATGLGGTMLLTRLPGLPTAIGAGLVKTALDAGAEPFELLEPVTLYTAHNRVLLPHLERRRVLPAARRDAGLPARRRSQPPAPACRRRDRAGGAREHDHRPCGRCRPSPAHAVRLTHVDPEAPLTDGVRGVPALRRDPVTDQPFVEIAWADGDALPFALCLSKRIGGALVTDMAGASATSRWPTTAAPRRRPTSSPRCPAAACRVIRSIAPRSRRSRSSRA